MRRLMIALMFAAAPTALMAQENSDDSNVYAVGELTVTAHDRSGEAVGGSTLTSQQIETFGKETVDQALDLIPGTNQSITGGSRNEALVYVRGFDRFQTTISIDGVRVFLPADNRIDFSRFLTADLSEIQVSKGYVSVMDGPGGLGGAINLVTKKPTKPFEFEARATSFTDGEAHQEATQWSARVGGRQGQFYWQGSGAVNDRDHFTLSKDFKPVVTTLEDGGERGHSDSHDSRYNVKAGWQPNDTDEYSINYTTQKGEKNAPYDVANTASTRFWSWPYWNLDSIAFLSTTKLSDQMTLRTRLYNNSFDNLLSSFDSAAQTTQSLPRAFNSYYEDDATGGNGELTFDFSPTDQAKGGYYVRRDVHRERQDGFVRTPPTGSPSANTGYHEPWQRTEETTSSVAAQYLHGIGENVDLTVGASYDWTDLKIAEEINTVVTGTTIANSVITYQPLTYPTKNMNAWNGQAALVWRVDPDTRLHFSVSDRARFPTLFERFSQRMGTAVPNPNITAERAINYEVGGQKTLGHDVKAEGAVFYSDVQDALIQIPITLPAPIGNVNQTQNVAKGTYSGAELSIEAPVSDQFKLGGNATWLHRSFTDTHGAVPADVKLQGVPDFKGMAYVSWTPISKLTVTPSVEVVSSRWTVQTFVHAPTSTAVQFYKTGAYTLYNLSANYDITDNVSASFIAENIGDQNYSLTDGFPEAGRSYAFSLKAKY